MSQFIYLFTFSFLQRVLGEGMEGEGEGAGLTYSRQLVEFSWVVHRYDCFLEGWCFVRKHCPCLLRYLTPPFILYILYIYLFFHLSIHPHTTARKEDWGLRKWFLLKA
ncbi:hypothetical protein B9Z19DRAFT_1084501 [Tuber borchii]|uniref:Uncharacterized protein n=1 Tax=Tuber borchii TaxID=42251 RepID=A0A2T6ZRY8_TUBBO|nr:hypothetical protein B9Z19DRAFT_1084501 [Tuber borchii]